MDQTTALQAQADGLRAEITALQQQRDHNLTSMNLHVPVGEHMQDLLGLVCGARAGVQADRRQQNALSLLEAQTKELQESLDQQTQFNGFSLTSCNFQTLDLSATKVVQKVCLTGQCCDLLFEVEFHLSEVKIEDRTERTVTGLNVVMNTEHIPDLSSFVTRVEENNDLLLLFRTMRRFCQRRAERYAIYQGFQEKYASIVSFPGGCRSEVMAINHPKLPGCVLFIHWSVGVSIEGQVTTNIELLTKIPETAVQMSSSLVEEAPQSFRSLLAVLGPKDAIDALIKSVSV